MLAVKRALARTDEALTYVFDEVDTGVGGGTAEVIGRKLKAIAADRQVIAVTHLPQIAAFADAHIRVSKSRQPRQDAASSIEPLAEAERAGEIARMLAGAPPSREAAAHADEMLRRARMGKGQRASTRREKLPRGRPLLTDRPLRRPPAFARSVLARRRRKRRSAEFKNRCGWAYCWPG